MESEHTEPFGQYTDLESKSFCSEPSVFSILIHICMFSYVRTHTHTQPEFIPEFKCICDILVLVSFRMSVHKAVSREVVLQNRSKSFFDLRLLLGPPLRRLQQLS